MSGWMYCLFKPLPIGRGPGWVFLDFIVADDEGTNLCGLKRSRLSWISETRCLQKKKIVYISRNGFRILTEQWRVIGRSRSVRLTYEAKSMCVCMC